MEKGEYNTECIDLTLFTLHGILCHFPIFMIGFIWRKLIAQTHIFFWGGGGNVVKRGTLILPTVKL